MTVDGQIEDAIRVLLDEKGDGTVSLTEAARVVAGPRWRSLTPSAKRVASKMVQSGEIEITNAQRVRRITTI